MQFGFGSTCLVFLAKVTAQEGVDQAFLRVGDLLQPAPCSSPYLTTAPVHGRRHLRGEETWVEFGSDVPSQPYVLKEQANAWFSEDAFRMVLSDLLDRDEPSLRILQGGSMLMVSQSLRAPIGSLLDELRQRLPPIVRFDLQLVRIDAEGEHVMLARSLEVSAGRRGWASAVQESNAVFEFDVEIAQGSVTANPIATRWDCGAMVAVRPIVALGSPDGWFEVLARVVEPGAESRFESGETACGAIDRIHQVVHEFAGVVQGRVGGAVRQRWQGAAAAFELRLVPTWQVPAPTSVGARDVEYLPRWPDFRGFRSVPWLREGSEEVPAVITEFQSALEAANAVARAAESVTANFGIDAEATALRALQRARVQQQTAVSIHIEAFDAPAGSKPGDDGSLPLARRLADVELQTVLGSWACVTAYEELGYVPDWDVEVAQAARIPDPKVERLAAGLFLNVRCGDNLVEIEGELSWRGAIEGRLVQLNQVLRSGSMVSATAASSNSAVAHEQPSVQLPADIVRIESIPLSRLPVQGQLPLRRDHAATWRCTSPLLAVGRELIVLVRRAD